MLGTTFERNTAVQYGGAIATTDNATLDIQLSSFVRNGVPNCASAPPHVRGQAAAAALGGGGGGVLSDQQLLVGVELARSGVQALRCSICTPHVQGGGALSIGVEEFSISGQCGTQAGAVPASVNITQSQVRALGP